MTWPLFLIICVSFGSILRSYHTVTPLRLFLKMFSCSWIHLKHLNIKELRKIVIESFFSCQSVTQSFLGILWSIYLICTWVELKCPHHGWRPFQKMFYKPFYKLFTKKFGRNILGLLLIQQYEKRLATTLVIPKFLSATWFGGE